MAVAGTIIMFSMYAVVQQSIRLNANDPQIQIAQDGSLALSGSTSPRDFVGTMRIDMHASLAPFVIVYDDSNKVLASSGLLNGEVPVLPTGVFDYTRKNIEDRITWQPASTTRVAAVVRYFHGANNGFIVVGRNLREIEKREHQFGLMVGAAWVGLLVLTFMASTSAWIVERKETL